MNLLHHSGHVLVHKVPDMPCCIFLVTPGIINPSKTQLFITDNICIVACFFLGAPTPLNGNQNYR